MNKEEIKKLLQKLGLDTVGIAPIGPTTFAMPWWSFFAIWVVASTHSRWSQIRDPGMVVSIHGWPVSWSP